MGHYIKVIGWMMEDMDLVKQSIWMVVIMKDFFKMINIMV